MREQSITICETVKVIATYNESPICAVSIPAYSRSEESFRGNLEGLVELYISRSKAMGAAISTADFALFLVDRASKEPGHQEELG